MHMKDKWNPTTKIKYLAFLMIKLFWIEFHFAHDTLVIAFENNLNNMYIGYLYKESW